MDIERNIDEQDELLEFDDAFIEEVSQDLGATLSVREINEAISLAISDAFTSQVWVKGEVQRLRFHSSGHIYFDLVDAGSKGASACSIPVTLLKWNASKIRGNLRELLVEDREIRLLARPDFYAPYGKMSLAASSIDTAFSLGQIALARRELISKLTSEGILRKNAETQLTEMVTSIALVTAVDSAAYHDVVDQLKNSGYGYKIKAINALMQGKESVPSVIDALKFADKLDVDVVLLCRGGGAKSDLAAFDSEKIARTIIAMEKPVMTGLGHQIDISVADIVAHSTFKTPTACAQFIIEQTKHAVGVLEELLETTNTIVSSRIDNVATRLANISQRMGDVSHVLDTSSENLKTTLSNIRASSKRAFENSKEYLLSQSALIKAHDPMRVLERGYSMTLDSSGKAIKSIKDVTQEQEIFTRVRDGEIKSKVQQK